MYEVMLVDEAQGELFRLQEEVLWGKYDCKVVATATNGRTALDKAHEIEPDIIFTAIRLAELDGLSLIGALQVIYPNMQTTIVSGYSSLSYAQRSIELGVTRYLLKPVGAKQMEEALMSMVTHLNVIHQVKKTIAPAQENILTDNFVVSNALIYMEEHYHRSLTLPEVAEQGL